MDDFYKISGLSLNIKKTKVMIIGTPYTQRDIEDIEELGFTHATSTTVLGFHIDDKLNDLNHNWNKIINNMQITSNIFKPSLASKLILSKCSF